MTSSRHTRVDVDVAYDSVMDPERRNQLATAALGIVPELERIVADAWPDLIPASLSWSAAARRRANNATRAALEGIVTIFQQGDLDDRTWASTRDTIFAHGAATPEEAEDLLRSVRVVGVEAMVEHLGSHYGISPDERWTMQREADAFCAQLRDEPDQIDPAAIDDLLAVLEADGPDLS